MRPWPRAIAVGIAGSCLLACAALTGLDQITEDACVPDCDASALGGAQKRDASGRDGAGTTTESGGTLDAEGGVSSPEADAESGVSSQEAGGEGGVSTQEAGADGGRSSQEAGIDAAPEAAVDAGADSNVAPVDAGSATDSGDDSPCGSVYLSESFDSAPDGWTLDTSWSIAPTCANPPLPTEGNPDPTVDHTTGMAGGVLGAYVCGNNPLDMTNAFRYATSPTVDVSAAPAVMLRFYRWLNSDRSAYMTSTVDVFNGTSWVNLYTNPSASTVMDDAWTMATYDVTPYKNAAFQVRFGYAVTSPYVYSMSCWNVDDVLISSSSCP